MRTLVMTMLDLRKEPNQRTQHMVRMLADISRETVIVSKVKVLDRSWRAVVRDALTFHAHVTHEGSQTLIALHPPLNYAQALAAGLVQGSIVRGPSLARRWAAGALSAAGILRDFLLVPSFVLAVLFKSRGRFDLCLVEGPWAGCAALALRSLGRVGHIVYDDIDLVAGGQMLRLRSAYTALLERLAIRRADLVISAGSRLGEHRRRTTRRAVRVIPNGVDPAPFAAAHQKRVHPPTLVYVGHLAHYSGVDLAILALPLIAQRLPDVRLVVIGDGDTPYIAGLRELAEAQGVSERVELRGRLPYADVPAVLAECDIGLSTSRATPLRVFAFPLKIVEYMAAGLPLLCTRGTEAEEILTRYPAGIAIDFTPQALANAAVKLLTDSALYGRAVQFGLEGAQMFTWERAVSDQRDAILDMLESSTRRPAALRT